MGRNIKAAKRGFGYRHATGGRGGLGLYSDGLLMAEYENYLGNDEPVIVYGKNLTGVDQWFTEESETQNYAIGTKLVVEDMVFYYGHCAEYAEEGNWKGRGMMNLGKQTSNAHTDPGHRRAATITAWATGATVLYVTMDSAYAPIADEFEDGQITVNSSPWDGMCRGRIRTNDAELASGLTTFYLKEGIVGGNTAGTTVDARITWNQYAHFGLPAVGSIANRCCCVGCANLSFTENYYGWLQTWGPFAGQTGEYGSEDMGLGPYNTQVYFDAYGGFINPATNSIYGEGIGKAQLAGFIVASRAGGAAESTNWSPLVMLQICP